MRRQQQLVRRDPESAAGFLLGDHQQQHQQQNSFSSRAAAAHCQTVAADLSLHSSTSTYPPTSASYPTSSSSSFPPTSEPPPLFYPLLPARTPLTHSLAGYDFYQQGAAEFSSEALAPPPPQPFSDYQEYYDRWLFCKTMQIIALTTPYFDLMLRHICDRLPYTYDETGLALAERPPYPDFSMKVKRQF